MKNNTNKMIKISLLCALSIILMYFDFPIIPAFAWLKIDLSDVPALLGAFGFGPVAGVVIELVKNLMIPLIKGSQTGFVGETANLLVGVSLIFPAAFVYKKFRSKKGAIIGMFLGFICIEAVGIIANIYLLLPAYGMKDTFTPEMMQSYVYALLFFNGLKAVLVNTITYLLYKRISVAIFHVDSNFDTKVNKNQALQ